MDKAVMAIIGAGVIGAGALILMGSTPTSQAGGAFGGGESKKELVATEPLTTETITTETLAPVITYNIPLPAPDFPAIPQSPLTEPWWVTSIDPPPDQGSITKKEIVSGKTLYPQSYGVASEPKGTIHLSPEVTGFEGESRIYMGESPSKKMMESTAEKYGVPLIEIEKAYGGK